MTLDPLTGTRMGRRARERERRRKQRRRLAVAGAASVVVLLLVVTVLIVKNGGKGAGGVKTPVRTQRTLLLQVKAPDGTAEASALLAHDPASKQGAVVLLPQQVLVNVPGGGSVTFARSLQAASPAGSREALSDLMGVLVDGSWVLDEQAFGRLVQQVGSLKVDVDVPVVAGRRVLLQPGSQQLNGAQALQFATYLGAGEQEQTRLTRLQSVLDALISALPAKSSDLVRSLGAGSQVSAQAGDVGSLLAGLKADDGASDLQYRSLPVIKVDSGNDDVRFRVDPVATRSLVDDVLAGSIPPGSRADGNRVLVLNGVGTPGLGQQVRAKLLPAGFVFVGSRNAPSFGYAKTQVLVKDDTSAGAALGARVAQALGLPNALVESSDQIGSIADVIVVVGKDFRGK